MDFVNQLKKARFNVVYAKYSSEYFGNSEIRVTLENGYNILCINDRGIYECFIEYPYNFKHTLIPIKFLTYVLWDKKCCESFSFIKQEDLFAFLESNKKRFDVLNRSMLRTVYVEWKRYHK